jgi:hypothetical protein
MTEIAIPESLQFYFKSLENARSIDRLIDSRSSKASEIEDMGWDDLRQFYQAQLAAFKTQVDYWQFCDDVWRETWGNALANLSECSELDFSEYNDHEIKRNLEFAWTYSISKVHAWKGGALVTQVFCDAECLLIGFYCQSKNGDYELSNSLVLSDKWGPVEEDQRSLKKKLVKLRGQNVIDLSMLKAETEEVITGLEQELA